MPHCNTIEEVVEDLQNGRMVVVVDERATSGEGDEVIGEGELMMIAELATADAINFMMRHAGSPPTVAARRDHLSKLDIHEVATGSRGPRGATRAAHSCGPTRVLQSGTRRRSKVGIPPEL